MVPRSLLAPEVPSGMCHSYVQDIHTLRLTLYIVHLSFIPPITSTTNTNTLHFEDVFSFMFNFIYNLVLVWSTEIVSALAVAVAVAARVQLAKPFPIVSLSNRLHCKKWLVSPVFTLSKLVLLIRLAMHHMYIRFSNISFLTLNIFSIGTIYTDYQWIIMHCCYIFNENIILYWYSAFNLPEKDGLIRNSPKFSRS